MIFAGYTSSKNQVRNRQKIKIKNQFREIEILKDQVQIDKGGKRLSDMTVVDYAEKTCSHGRI